MKTVKEKKITIEVSGNKESTKYVTKNQMDDEKEYIGTYHEAPHYMQDNENIIRGYRIRFNSKRKILKSLFMIHNESVNVWSHLIGVSLFICLIIYTSLYLAPPGLYSEVKESIAHKWLGDKTLIKEKNS